MQPNSMAVDRNANAWVNYVDNDGLGDTAGAIFQVSTSDASCQPTAAVDLPSGWYRLGMGSSTDGANSSDETLFVTALGSSNASAGLGRVDLSSGQLAPVGTFTGAYAGQSAELTGTGDGRLYGFFTSTPIQVAELSKTSGDVLSGVPLNQVEIPFAWAFSFWGGDFYLYTATLNNSRVNRYLPSDGSVDTNYLADVGFRIIGAGVSTCAPLEMPN